MKLFAFLPLALILAAAGQPAARSDDRFGITTVERPNPPIHLHSRDIPTRPDVVIDKVHPKSLAEQLGMKEDDVLTVGWYVRGDEGRSRFVQLNTSADVQWFLNGVRDLAVDDEVVIRAMHPVPKGKPVDSGDYQVTFKAGRLK